MPDHFVAIEAPNATPAAKRHGRQIGDGTRVGGGGSTGSSAVASGSSA